MRNVRLWRGLLGVDKRTVIEDIELDEEGADGAGWWWCGYGHAAVFHVAVGTASEGRRCMTGVRVGAGGGAWIGARCRWCWRPTRRG